MSYFLVTMENLSHLPHAKRAFLAQLTNELCQVPGIAALVLGGSYASGRYHDASDLDIGLYYYEAKPFSIDRIRAIAQACAGERAHTVTEFYEWGGWVNGGAWIQTEVGKVDFLYRNIDQVEHTIVEAEQGIIRHDYAQQPTFGFYSVIYLAETNICIPLYDPDAVLAGFKRRVSVYPPRLKEKVIKDFLWSAEFTLGFARSYAAKGDVYNTAGCLARVAGALTQVLYGLNEIYYLSDKQVMQQIEQMENVPSGYTATLTKILAHPGETQLELAQSVGAMEAAWSAVAGLAGEIYRPRYVI